MVRHASPVKSPAIRISVAVMLTVAVFGALWVPIYAHVEPKLGAFPFFYWYQLMWVVLTGLLMVAAYWAIKVDEGRRKRARGAGGAKQSGPAGLGGSASAEGAGE